MQFDLAVTGNRKEGEERNSGNNTNRDEADGKREAVILFVDLLLCTER